MHYGNCRPFCALCNLQKVKTGKEQELKEKDDTISQLQKKIEDLQRLAICGDLPSSITERTYSMVVNKIDVASLELC